jgi:hypothetical protein
MSSPTCTSKLITPVSSYSGFAELSMKHYILEETVLIPSQNILFVKPINTVQVKE